MEKSRKLSYTQSIGLFALISVLPLYLFFIWVYQASYSMIHKELLTSISLEGEKIVDDLDRDLTNLSLRLDETKDLPCVRRVMLEDSRIFSHYEIISAKQELMEITTVVLLNSQVLDSISFFFPRTGSTYRDAHSWSKMNDEQRDYLTRLLREPEGKLVYFGGEFLLYRTNRRAGMHMDSTADIVMVMGLSEQRIAQLFALRVSDEQRNIFLLKSDTGELIASTNADMANDIVRLHAEGAIPTMNTISLGGIMHYALAMRSSFDALTLYYVVSSGAVSVPMSQFVNFLAVSLVLLALILLLLFIQSYFFLYKPVRTLLKGFRAVENGELAARLGPTSTREFDALNNGFNNMVESLRQLIDQRYKLRMLAREAEFRQLYSQINPHFLYNCFFTVASMLEEENYDCCVDLTHLLGEYLQYMTKTKQTTVHLFEELQHANAYAEIQKVRFSKRVNFAVAPIPDGWENFEVPRLILQPLLENAFEHGVKDRLDFGVIRLCFIDAKTELTIVVENDGDGLSELEIEQIRRHATIEPSGVQGIALYNINSRLKLMGAVPDGLSFSVSPLGGLAVSFKLRRDQKGLSVCTE